MSAADPAGAGARIAAGALRTQSAEYELAATRRSSYFFAQTARDVCERAWGTDLGTQGFEAFVFEYMPILVKNIPKCIALHANICMY